ncbi:hypothetical protein F2Q69_00004242 [Brassica cretica]|uniref:Uncharacterized protein n=1 Tax=Brassica cretica TaxID=69181 RepID=A0A8S9NY23_BRACR|nr:hypothetical protein F2Q69_00004242 [Brassica cretica]
MTDRGRWNPDRSDFFPHASQLSNSSRYGIETKISTTLTPMLLYFFFGVAGRSRNVENVGDLMGMDMVMLDGKGSAKQRGFVLKKIESLTVSELNSSIFNFPPQSSSSLEKYVLE